MPKALNSPYLSLALLALFIWLANYAWHKHPPVHRTAFNQFVDQQVAAYHPKDSGVVYQPADKEKLVYVWRDRKSAAVAEALSLTLTSIDDTVDVRGQR